MLPLAHFTLTELPGVLAVLGAGVSLGLLLGRGAIRAAFASRGGNLRRDRS